MKVINYSTVDSEIHLTKYRKKGFLRLVFSRLVWILILLFLQLYLFYGIFSWMKGFYRHYSYVMVVFRIIMTLFLFNNDMESSAKLTWLIIISIAPVPGSLFLAYTITDLGHIKLKRNVLRVIEETAHALPENMDVVEELGNERRSLKSINTYLNKTGCFPVYKDTDVTYYPTGEACFDDLIAELEKAEKFIFMEFFIYDEGYMWGKVLKILADKVKAGVEVRVMYDGMCEMELLPHNYAARLCTLGIKAKTFSPIHPFISTYYNYRDHRKVLVVDGKVAVTGGINMADEYINRIERFGHWKDSVVFVRGNAVKSFTLMFLQMWSADEPKVDLGNYLEIDGGVYPEASGYVMPYSDIPLDDEKVGENVYMDILNRASKYVHITTPYLILDDELKRALKYAAARGVEVSIILPGIPDKLMAYSLAKNHYKSLVKSGVNIYEYTPGFMHAKNFICDDKKAVVGSINLDYRSLYHHFECALYMYKTDCIEDIERDFQEAIKVSKKITLETIKKENILYRASGHVMKLVAPLM